MPVDAIAEDLCGLVVEEVRDLDVSGMLIPAERRVYLNAVESPRRRRFTLAHELGHWVCQYLEGRRHLAIAAPRTSSARPDRSARARGERLRSGAADAGAVPPCALGRLGRVMQSDLRRLGRGDALASVQPRLGRPSAQHPAGGAIDDRSRPTPEAAARRRPPRRDGSRWLVEHERDARPSRGDRARAWPSADAPVRSGARRLRCRAVALRGALRSRLDRDALEAACRGRGSVRRALADRGSLSPTSGTIRSSTAARDARMPIC